MPLLIIFYFIIAINYTAGDAGWSYDNAGEWGRIDKQCDGKSQSPVQVWREDVEVDTSIAKLKFINYNGTVLANERIVNNGHSVQIDVLDDTNLSISGATLPDDYALKQFHFHWANGDADGSEHGVGHEKYPLELHLVHTRKGVDIPKALEDKDRKGLAVVGVKYTITPENNTELAKIIKHFGEIPYQNQNASMSESINLFKYLPEDAESNFYLYDGSLTTPPCTETVQWIVLSQYSTVSSAQMVEFRRLFQTVEDSTAPQRMMNTNRPMQKLNNRKIKTRTYFYIPAKELSGKGTSDSNTTSKPTMTEKTETEKENFGAVCGAIVASITAVFIIILILGFVYHKRSKQVAAEVDGKPKVSMQPPLHPAEKRPTASIKSTQMSN